MALRYILFHLAIGGQMTEPGRQVTELVAGMRHWCDAYETDGLALDRLSWELKSRIAALRQVANEEWVDELKAIWNELEVVNAFYIESGRATLNSSELQEIREILKELRTALLGC